MANIQIKNKEPVLGILYIIALSIYPDKKKVLSAARLETLFLVSSTLELF